MKRLGVFALVAGPIGFGEGFMPASWSYWVLPIVTGSWLFFVFDRVWPEED